VSEVRGLSDSDLALLKVYAELMNRLPGGSWPSALLPASKQRIAVAIERALANADASQVEYLRSIREAVDLFRTPNTFQDDVALRSFRYRIVIYPALLSSVYALLLGIRGSGWIWSFAALGIWVGGLASANFRPRVVREEWPRRSRVAWLGLLILEYLTLGCGLALAVRLTLGSGVYGLYRSTLVSLNVIRATLSLTALLVGLGFARALNRMRFFLFDWFDRFYGGFDDNDLIN